MNKEERIPSRKKYIARLRHSIPKVICYQKISCQIYVNTDILLGVPNPKIKHET